MYLKSEFPMTSGKHLRNLGRILLNLGRIPCRSIVGIPQHLEIFPTVKSDFDNIDKNLQDLIKNKRDGYKPSLISAFSGNSFFRTPATNLSCCSTTFFFIGLKGHFSLLKSVI